ncbi:MAG: hypothetical protein JKX87_05805 [Cycloclasticus sp.]|nr:hypothetical protein [Cycloclasticus sp.]
MAIDNNWHRNHKLGSKITSGISSYGVCNFAIITTSLISTQAISLDLSLPYEETTALTILTGDDWDLLKTTAREALNNSEDGSSHAWQNDKTLHAGVVTILTTTITDNSHCRNTRFINTAGELTSTTLVNLCKQGDKWTEASPRTTTTTTTPSLPPPNPSILFSGSVTPSANNQSKRSDDTTGYCLELSKNIDKLKGKPLRRNAAAELFKAECQR